MSPVKAARTYNLNTQEVKDQEFKAAVEFS